MPDRLAERAELARILKSGGSVQMPGPRRIGKTWLMHGQKDDRRPFRSVPPRRYWLENNAA